MVKAFKYKLYPTRAQAALMMVLLERLRLLYNAALQERREAYRKCGVSITRSVQEKSLTEIRAADEDYEAIHTHLLQDVITRLDRAFQAFFRRCKAGEKPGYPRFKGYGRYRTFTYKDAKSGNGAKMVAGEKRVRLTGIGKVKIKLHRPLEGRVKTIGVMLDSDGKWYAVITCDQVATKPLPPTGKTVGVDVGITTFAALSDGTMVENPRHLDTARRALTLAQRKVSRRKRGSHRRRKAVVLLAKQHARVSNVRKDFHHKVALDLVQRYDRITVEDLNVKGLARGFLARSVNDAAWAQFFTITACKAESAGRVFNRRNPAGTSQLCSACGGMVAKTLSVRVHRCPHCGYTVDRDTNAAQNIHQAGALPSASGPWGLRRPEKPSPRSRPVSR